MRAAPYAKLNTTPGALPNAPTYAAAMSKGAQATPDTSPVRPLYMPEPAAVTTPRVPRARPALSHAAYRRNSPCCPGPADQDRSGRSRSPPSVVASPDRPPPLPFRPMRASFSAVSVSDSIASRRCRTLSRRDRLSASRRAPSQVPGSHAPWSHTGVLDHPKRVATPVTSDGTRYP